MATRVDTIRCGLRSLGAKWLTHVWTYGDVAGAAPVLIRGIFGAIRCRLILVERYAKRMLIENGMEDNVNFFHMDALSSAVAMKVNCDVQLTRRPAVCTD